MTENAENEVKAAGPNGRVIGVHSTSVDMTSSWSRTEQFRKMRSPSTASYYNDIFAFQLPNTEGDRKTHYSFIHHYVDSDGSAGAASMRALGNAVAVLNGGRNGTVLRGSARQGVYRHIAAHYRDAEREAPELKSDEDVDAIMMFKGLIDAPLAETLDLTVKGLDDLDNIIDVDSHVVWVDGDVEAKGIVLEADDENALVEEIDEDDLPTGELFQLEYSEMKLRTFVVMEKVDAMAEAGSIVSWKTTQGTFYGDVVEVATEGKVRGEPQGLELEGTEENPAYLIRVWMQEMPEDEADEGEDEDEPKSTKSAGEWTPTNVTVVARGDALTVEEALPTGAPEEGYDDEEEDEETAMKSIDPEFRALVKRVIEDNAEVLKRLAEMDGEEKSTDELTETVEAVSTEETTEVKSDNTTAEELKTEEMAAATDDTVAEEIKSEDAPTEEIKSEEQNSESVVEIVNEENTVTEAKSSISFDELKEFHNLLKEVTK